MALTEAVYDRILMIKKSTINQGVALEEREKRDLSTEQMAEILGIEGPNAMQIVREFETGHRPVKGSVLRVYEFLNRSSWAATRLLEIPRWTVVNQGPGRACTIHHNEWPRFVGRAFDVELHPEQWRFKKTDMPVFLMDERTGYRQLVIAWIDHVPEAFDPEDLLEEGLRHLEQQILEKTDER